MVDLPELTFERGATIQGPHDGRGAQAYASAFEHLGAELSAVGEKARQQAKIGQTEQAFNQGENAVTRDADGNLQVQFRPNDSAQNIAYNRAAHTSYLAGAEMSIHEKSAELAREANGDVTAYDNAWKGFKNGFLKNAPRGPVDMSGPVSNLLDNTGIQQRQGIITARQNDDLKDAWNTINVSIKAKDDQMDALAQQGGTDTPEYKRLQADVHHLIGEKADNPNFNYTREQADIDIKRMESGHMASAMLGQVEKTYKDQGPEAANKLVDRFDADPNLLLTPAERREFTGAGRQYIKAARSAEAADAKEWTDKATSLRTIMAGGGHVDDTDVENTLDELQKRHGTVRDWMSLRYDWQTQKQVRALPGMDDAQQLETFRQMQGPRPSGGSVVDRIIGIESGGRPDAKNPNSTATGLGQFTEGTWLNTVRNHEPQLAEGRSRAELLALRNDPTVSRRVLGYLTSDNTGALQQAGLPVTDGNLYLAHFLGSGGAAKILKADPNAPIGQILPDAVKANPFLRGMSAAGVISWANRKMGAAPAEGGYGFDPKVVQQFRAEVTSDAKTMLGQIQTNLGKGNVPSADDLNYLTERARAIGDSDLIQNTDKVVSEAAKMSAFEDAPPQARGAMIADLQKGGVTSDEQQLYQFMTNVAESDRKAMDDNPVGLARARRIPGADTLGQPLDFSHNDNLVLGLRRRDELMNRLEHQWGLPEGSRNGLYPEEIQAFGNVLKDPGATAQGRAATLALLKSTLSDGHYKAVLNSIWKNDKDAQDMAVVGAVYQKSPAVGQAILQGFDALKQNPNFGWPKGDNSAAKATRESINTTLPADVLVGKEDARQQYIKMAEAYSAAGRAKVGNVTEGAPPQAEIDTALNAVTGGILDYNGHKLIAPRSGMTQDQLTAAVYGADISTGRGSYIHAPAKVSDVDLSEARLDGRPFTLESLRARDVHLNSQGDGVYVITKGDGVVRDTQNRAFYLRLGDLVGKGP